MTPVEAYVAAARARDFRGMHALVDWGVSGAASMVRGLSELDPDRRRELARAGSEELRGQPEDAFVNKLGSQARGLARPTEIRPATTAEAAHVRESLRVPPIPDGVPPDVVEELETIGQRANDISAVDALEIAGHRTLLAATIAATGRVVIVHAPED